MKGFLDYLMRIDNLLIVAAVWILLTAVVRVCPKLKCHPVWARLAPAAPMILCSIAVWIPGCADPELGVGSRILLGIVLGAMVANAHKIFGQSILGNDERINGCKNGPKR